jgi:mannosyltransferase OCH1-like enzyme
MGFLNNEDNDTWSYSEPKRNHKILFNLPLFGMIVASYGVGFSSEKTLMWLDIINTPSTVVENFQGSALEEEEKVDMEEDQKKEKKIINDILDIHDNPDTTDIPAIILQTWKSKTDIPEYLEQCRQSIRKHAPDFDYLFFDDEEMMHFMNETFGRDFPHLKEKFHRLPTKIQKIDFFRYALLYHHGGVYLDMDIILEHPLSELISFMSSTSSLSSTPKKHSLVFPIEYNMEVHGGICQHFVETRRRKHQGECVARPLNLGQFALASSPRNPFWLSVLNAVPDYDVDSPQPLFHPTDKNVEVYLSTGPDHVTHVYYDYMEKEKAQDQNVHMLWDPQPFRFGKYAQHLNGGSWKHM